MIFIRNTYFLMYKSSIVVVENIAIHADFCNLLKTKKKTSGVYNVNLQKFESLLVCKLYIQAKIRTKPDYKF